MTAFQTEYDFELPRGYIDASGNLHRQGRMRLATARDEIESMQDPLSQKSPSYLAVVILARVVTRLGALNGDGGVTPDVIQNLFAADFAYLQDLYNEINSVEGQAPPGEG